MAGDVGLEVANKKVAEVHGAIIRILRMRKNIFCLQVSHELPLRHVEARDVDEKANALAQGVHSTCVYRWSGFRFSALRTCSHMQNKARTL